MKPSAVSVLIAPIVGCCLLVATCVPPVWQAQHVIGLALLLPSLAVITIARLQLGNSFSVVPRATALVTHGLYARIRNPIYVFGVPFFTGLVLFLGHPAWLVVLLPLVVLQAVRARREGEALLARFGDEYRRYRAQTWF